MKTIHDPSTKPYYKCLSCPDFRHTCAGLPTRDMTLQEWCEMIRDVMDVFHLSCAYVAKESGASLKTVERIHACNIEQDIMRSTERSIERVVLGQVGNHQCYLDHNDCAITDRMASILAQNEHLLEENKRYATIIDEFIERRR